MICVEDCKTYIHKDYMGYKGIEVAEALSLSPSSVSRIVESGKNILNNKKDVAVKIADMEI